jgi:hypothetical protein
MLPFLVPVLFIFKKKKIRRQRVNGKQFICHIQLLCFSFQKGKRKIETDECGQQNVASLQQIFFFVAVVFLALQPFVVVFSTAR